VGRAVERAHLLDEVRSLRGLRDHDGGLAEAMGASALVASLVGEVRRVADTGLTVLLHGETGTGKELVARAIHHLSRRRNGPFVALDCGAVSESLLESELFGHERGAFTGAVQRHDGLLKGAAGGTVLLDEIGNLPPRLQSKLLRVLEERQVLPVGASRPIELDVRFLAATNEELERAVETNTFRRDLYFRLAEYTLRLPPLRQRPEDIPHLTARFLRDFGGPPRRLTPEALAELQRHPWPGNVRQLRNVTRQAAVAADGPNIGARHLRIRVDEPAPPVPYDGRPLKEIADAAAREAEIGAIREALRAAGGNRAEAARVLQVDYKTLYLKLKRYQIE
jgi:DNA-binding NtrC family response regulator